MWTSPIIETKLASDKSITRVLVIRSPGIGKSVFGELLFLFAIKQKKSCLWSSFFTWIVGTEEWYDITDYPYMGIKYEGYFNGNNKGDAFKFHIFNCVFLFSSPHCTNYNMFVKDHCFRVYLNPWNQTRVPEVCWICQLWRQGWVATAVLLDKAESPQSWFQPKFQRTISLSGP